MNVTKRESVMGVEIRGLDLTSITPTEFDELFQLWIESSVVVIKGQNLDDNSLMEFSARFGPLERIPMGKLSGPSLDEKLAQYGLENAYVTAISNIVEDGRKLGGLGNGEAEWHSDMTYIETPPTASVLYAVEVPASGGDTHFASQWAAVEAMPSELVERARCLTIKHDAAHTSVGDLRPGFEEVESPVDAPGSAHPIIQKHPESGREVLYLGRRDWAYIPGLGLDESEALLDEIWSYAALPENCFTQQWQVGDVVIWDNRSVLHRRAQFPSTERRMMRRCQVLAG